MNVCDLTCGVTNILLELRKNPEKNNEPSGHAGMMKFLESIPKNDLPNWFVHMSWKDKFGINPSFQVTNGVDKHIAGIYCWSAKMVIDYEQPFAKVRQYGFVFRVSPTNQTPLTDLLFESMKKYTFEKLGYKISKTWYMDDSTTPEEVISSGTLARKFLLSNNVKFMIDTNGLMSGVKNECVVLDSKCVDKLQKFKITSVEHTNIIRSDIEELYGLNNGSLSFMSDVPGYNRREKLFKLALEKRRPFNKKQEEAFMEELPIYKHESSETLSTAYFVSEYITEFLIKKDNNLHTKKFSDYLENYIYKYNFSGVKRGKEIFLNEYTETNLVMYSYFEMTVHSKDFADTLLYNAWKTKSEDFELHKPFRKWFDTNVSKSKKLKSN